MHRRRRDGSKISGQTYRQQYYRARPLKNNQGTYNIVEIFNADSSTFRDLHILFERESEIVHSFSRTNCGRTVI